MCIIICISETESSFKFYEVHSGRVFIIFNVFKVWLCIMMESTVFFVTMCIFSDFILSLFNRNDFAENM